MLGFYRICQKTECVTIVTKGVTIVKTFQLGFTKTACHDRGFSSFCRGHDHDRDPPSCRLLVTNMSRSWQDRDIPILSWSRSFCTIIAGIVALLLYMDFLLSRSWLCFFDCFICFRCKQLHHAFIAAPIFLSKPPKMCTYAQIYISVYLRI